MKKIFVFICIIFSIQLTYSNLNEATYDGNQPDYCATLTKSDATKYDFYKCAYFEKIREQNKIHIPTQAELEEKRYKEYLERERKRNKKIVDDINKQYKLEWSNKINDLKKVGDLIKLNLLEEQLQKESHELFTKNYCKIEKDCIDAIYNLKYAIIIDDYINETNLNVEMKSAVPFINNQIEGIYGVMIYEYIKKGNYNKVIEYALLLNDEKEKKDFLATAYSGLAYDYYKVGKYNNSIEYSLLADGKGYNPKWYIYYIIGLSSYELKNYNDAILYFKKSLRNTDDEENIKVLNKNIRISNDKIKLEENLVNSIKTGTCGIKSIESNDGNCTCEEGYKWESSKDLNNLNCKKIEESINVKLPENEKECHEQNGINSYWDNRGYCLCEKGFGFSENSGYTLCEERQSSILRKKIDEKMLLKLDKILEKLLLKPKNTLVILVDKIDLLLKKDIDEKIKNILLYIKLIINDKLVDDFEFDDLFN